MMQSAEDSRITPVCILSRPAVAATSILLQHSILAFGFVDIALSVLEMFQAEEIALVRDLDFDFFGLLSGVRARKATTGIVDGTRSFFVVPRFALVVVASGVDACG